MIERVLAILCLAACWVGCSSGQSPEGAKSEGKSAPATAAAAAVQDPRLIGREWRLESFGPVGDERPPVGIYPITLLFSQDGWLDGSAGCNTYRTTYRAGADGTIAVRAPVRSNKSCPSTIGRQEQVYLDVLHRAESYEVHDDRLLVFYEGGSRNLVYTGATSSSAPGGSSQTPSS